MIHCTILIRCTIVALLLVAGVLPGAARAAVTYDTIALSGPNGTSLGLGPGLGPDVDFVGFQAFGEAAIDTAVLNAAGEVAFFGSFSGTDVDMNFIDGTGIWSNAGGTAAAVALAALTFDPMTEDETHTSLGLGPGLGAGIDFSSFIPPVLPVLNDAGEVAFLGELIGTGVDETNDQGIWTNAGGLLAVVARTGSDGPGPGVGAGVNFGAASDDAFYSLVFNAAGEVAFNGELTGMGVDFTNNSGIWTNVGGSLAVMAREGSDGPDGPGLGAGVHFSFLSDSAINAAGKVAFFGELTGTGVDSSNDSGIWTHAGGAMTLVARKGINGPGPGLGAGIHFNGFGFIAPGLNAAGEVAFEGRLIGTGVNSSNNEGIWTNAGGSLAVVARTGSVGPGPSLGEGVHFDGFGFNGPVLNAAGEVAFFGELTGTDVDFTNNEGIWSNAGGTLAVVARTGSDGPDGPGLGAGVHFDDFGFDGPVVLNAAGEVAFFGHLTGTGVDFTNDEGLWTNVGGTLQMIVRKGDLFDVDPTAGVDMRTISGFPGIGFVTGSGGEDGRRLSFNDNGLLTFRLDFDDNFEFSTGIFTANPNPVVAACATCPADLNGDNAIDGSDIQQFTDCVILANNGAPTAGCDCADVVVDAMVDGADVSEFASVLLEADPGCN